MSRGRVVIFAGSPADKAHVEAIARALGEFGIPSTVRIASAHKTPERLLGIIAEYEAEPIPTVYVTAAGRSNALSGLVTPLGAVGGLRHLVEPAHALGRRAGSGPRSGERRALRGETPRPR